MTRSIGKTTRSVALFGLVALSACAGAPRAQDRLSNTGVRHAAEAAIRTYTTAWRALARQQGDVSPWRLQELPIRRRNNGDGTEVHIRTAEDAARAHTLLRGHCGDPASYGSASFYYRRFSPAVQRLTEHVRIGQRGGEDYPAYCPFWSLFPVMERFTLVQGLEANYPAGLRTGAVALRAHLLTTLDSLVTMDSDDVALRGQAVRYALEAEDFGAVDRLLATCPATEAVCLRLSGLRWYQGGQPARADSLFAAARAVRHGSAACQDSTLQYLYPERGASRAIQDCTEALAAEEQFWWLANPLWSVGYNARRLEHERRLMDLELRRTFSVDEYLDARPAIRAPAEELIVRYGWPSVIILIDSGSVESYHHFVSEDKRLRHRLVGAPVYVLGQTGVLRYAAVPSAAVLADPFAADAATWQRPVLQGAPLETQWPQEHVRLSLRDLGAAQVARFVRGRELAVAVATMLPDVSASGGTPPAAEFWAGSSPTVIGRIGVLEQQARTVAAQSGMVRVWGTMPAAPAVLSLEGVDGTGHPWRVRMGQRPTPGLLAAVDGGVGLSDVLLTRPFTGSEVPPIAEAVETMWPSEQQPTGMTQVGLAWEVYGLPAGTTLTYSLAVAVKSRPGLVVRALGLVLGRSVEAAAGGALKWTRPVGAVSADATPAFADGLTLTIGDWPAGEYELTLTVTPGGMSPVAATRRLILQ